MNETLLNMELNKSEYDIYKILKELKKEKILPGIWKLLLDDSVMNNEINYFTIQKILILLLIMVIQ